MRGKSCKTCNFGAQKKNRKKRKRAYQALGGLVTDSEKKQSEKKEVTGRSSIDTWENTLSFKTAKKNHGPSQRKMQEGRSRPLQRKKVTD